MLTAENTLVSIDDLTSLGLPPSLMEGSAMASLENPTNGKQIHYFRDTPYYFSHKNVLACRHTVRRIRNGIGRETNNLLPLFQSFSTSGGYELTSNSVQAMLHNSKTLGGVSLQGTMVFHVSLKDLQVLGPLHLRKPSLSAHALLE